MRPPLHPAMGEIVICARVALQLVACEFRKPRNWGLSPAEAATRSAMFLPPDYPGMIRFALHSLAVYLNLGMTSRDWLQNVLEAAHFGSSFRRCFFFAYKENRRPYPRVTNRGVQASRSPHHLALEPQVVNE